MVQSIYTKHKLSSWFLFMYRCHILLLHASALLPRLLLLSLIAYVIGIVLWAVSVSSAKQSTKDILAGLQAPSTFASSLSGLVQGVVLAMAIASAVILGLVLLLSGLRASQQAHAKRRQCASGGGEGTNKSTCGLQLFDPHGHCHLHGCPHCFMQHDGDLKK